MSKEKRRLAESGKAGSPWKRWGPYLSERQWGTVREDYSLNGDTWNHFPHEQARFRAYRWGEDGLAGISDWHQLLCLAFTLWNEKDPILKERLFGLSNLEGNHGEDVKEYYYYLDSTPTHSYMKYLYRYPQLEFPYQSLVEENARRDKSVSEFELIDTGVFDEDRYFDVQVEYAKNTAEDIWIRLTVFNRGPSSAPLQVLPTLWFRNTWSWERDKSRDRLYQELDGPRVVRIRAEHPRYGHRWLVSEGAEAVFFTENETNFRRLNGSPNPTPFVKDAFHRYLIEGETEAVNPEKLGSKCAAHFRLEIGPGEAAGIRLRLTDNLEGSDDFGPAFDELFSRRIQEADEFYSSLCRTRLSEDHLRIQRQAFAGLLWTKQYYHYDVRRWIDGDPNSASPPPRNRNLQWKHLHNSYVISMPDKWEFPWYAAWDLAFHCVVFALIDTSFAKQQLLRFLREWYMHPNGQLPAYEWEFSHVNPPVHAWAVWRVYRIEERLCGKADRIFLERAFHKLLLNFTWWVNRKDPEGRNVFQGGFLGLDNIGVFDRSAPLPTGGLVEQSDATSWMAMYCLNMLSIALELASHDPVYEDMASKFFEHFVYIAHAVDDLGEKGISLWNEEDGFYYDVITLPDGSHFPVRIRSMVGLIPLFAVETLEPEIVDRLPGFKKRMQWFIDHHPDIPEHIEMSKSSDAGVRRLLSIVNRAKLLRVLKLVLSEDEFLSPFGVRSLSRCHRERPYILNHDGKVHRVEYEPAESTSNLFGGNSNWRGPIWFPMNFLLIEALQRYHHYFGDDLEVEYPTGSGNRTSLWEVSKGISARLIRIFERDSRGGRPVFGGAEKFRSDPHWRDCLLFYEYFHGDNGAGLGASHQTGWTALVAKLVDQVGQ